MSTWPIHPLRGGVHPPQCKTLSNQQPIQHAPLPKQLIVPLLQHLGSPTDPHVGVGDYVLKGQLIADSANLISVPVHAPSSGIISFIGPQPYPHTSGQLMDAIVIDTDGLEKWCLLEPLADFHTASAPELLDKIRQAGISGLGGAGFPTVIKLSPAANQPIKTLIINGTECEPYITADDVLMREKTAQLITGIDILVRILQPENVLIAIEDNKPEAITAVRSALNERSYHVVALPTIYPSGGERQLIQILTGQEVPSAKIPAQLGILCQNVGTVVAIRDAIVEGKPLISRITTLTGEALHKPMNVECLIGTPVIDLLEFAGLQKHKMSRLIAGGPMMGFTLPSLHAPVIKTSNCLLAASAEELPAPPPAMPCIRCGDCAEVCPANLLPQQLHFYALGEDHTQLQAHNLFDCIECGACAYVCPSNIPLVQYYRSAKADIREQANKLAKAEHAKERFEFRLERLRLEEERKDAERKARAERLAKTKAEQAKKAAQAQKTGADNPAGASENEIKRLKIAASMAQVALRKAQKQLDAHGTEELQTQVEQLSVSAEQAKKALADATAAPQKVASSSAEDELKRLKIASSMARVALTKAQKQLETHDTEELQAQVEQLRVSAEHAKQALDAATAAASTPDVVEKPAKPEPSAAEQALKQAKIEAAMKRAALRKAERNEADAETLTALQAELTQAEQDLDKLNQTEEVGV